jgi:hypothetical protein
MLMANGCMCSQFFLQDSQVSVNIVSVLDGLCTVLMC